MDESEPGRLFVIPGGNAGLGFETARDLASASAEDTVVLACRDLGRGEQARQALVQRTGNTNVRVMQLDVSSLASVRDFVERLDTELQQPIDALICNAGISSSSSLTADGIDGVFATNHLGHYLLAVSLLDRMSPTGRIVSVSSDMHSPPGPKLVWPGAEAVAHPRKRSRAAIFRYSNSKLCNLYFTYELARRLRERGSSVAAVAFNPGLMTETGFAPSMPGPLDSFFKRLIASRVGALDTSGAALAHLAVESGSAIDGRYFDRTAATPSKSSDLSYDEGNARELWQLSAHLTGADL